MKKIDISQAMEEKLAHPKEELNVFASLEDISKDFESLDLDSGAEISLKILESLSKGQ